MDYRRRWQETRRKRFRTRLLIAGAVVLLGAVIGLLARGVGRRGPEWCYTPPEPGLAHFAVQGRQLFVVWASGRAAILDTLTGRARPEFPFGRPFPLLAEPLLVEGRAILGADDGRLHGVDLASGQALWEVRTGGAIRARPVTSSAGVLVGSDDGYLYCVAAATGEVRWRAYLGGRIGAAPAVSGTRAVVGTVDGNLWGVELSDNFSPPPDALPESARLLWNIATRGAVLGPGVEVAPDRVLVGTDGGVAYLLEASTGSVLASPPVRGLLRWEPAVSAGRVALADEHGRMVCVDAAGRVLWRRRLGGDLGAGLATDGQWIFAGTTAGRVVAARFTDGHVVWRERLPAPAAGSLQVTPGLVLVGLEDGRLCALRRPGQER